MQALRIVGFGLDCPDPSSPMLLQGLALIVTVLVIGLVIGPCIILILKVRNAVLRMLFIIICAGLGLGAAPIVYGFTALWMACGGLGL